jgi:hypothetical protein
MSHDELKSIREQINHTVASSCVGLPVRVSADGTIGEIDAQRLELSIKKALQKLGLDDPTVTIDRKQDLRISKSLNVKIVENGAEAP